MESLITSYVEWEVDIRQCKVSHIVLERKYRSWVRIVENGCCYWLADDATKQGYLSYYQQVK